MTRLPVRLLAITLAVGASAVTAVPAGADLPPELTQDVVAYYPFDEIAGTVVNDRSGNGRHAAIVNGNAGTVWSNGRGLTLPGRQRRDVARRSGCRTALLAGSDRRDDRLRRPALEHDAAGPGVRVRPDGGQRRVPDRDAGCRDHPPPASIAGPGANPVAQTATASGGARRAIRGSTSP